MPKDLPVKHLTGGPVATRTRLKLGSPIYKSVRIQYPDSWPLLHKAILFSKLQPSGALSSAPSSTISIGETESKEKLSIRSNRNIKKRQARRQCMQKFLGPLGLHIEPCKRRVRQKASVGRKIRGSYVDFVTFKPRRVKDSARRKQKSVKRKVSNSKKRRTMRSRRSQRYAKNKKVRKKIKRLGKDRKSQTRRRTAKRSKSKKKGRKTSRKTRKRRTRRTKRNRGDSTERVHRLEAEPPIGHAQDYMLKQKNTFNTEGFESGHDEIKDDPLNINDICRSLVKSLPGIPADCREENSDEKSTKPEHMKASYKARYENSTTKVRGDSAAEDADITETDGSKSTSKSKIQLQGHNCVRELRALLKDCKHDTLGKCRNKANSQSHSRTMRHSINTRQRYYTKRILEQKTPAKTENINNFVAISKNDEELKSDEEQKSTEIKEDGAHTTGAVVQQRHQDSQQGIVNDDKKTASENNNSSMSLNNHNLELAVRKEMPSRANKLLRQKTRTKTNVIRKPSVQDSKMATPVHDPKMTRGRPSGNGEPQTSGRTSLKHKQRHDKENHVATPLPYHGKPVPRNRRREDIDIVKKQGKDIELFVKRVRGKRKPKSKKSTRKQKSAQRGKRRRRASSRSRKTLATRLAGGAKRSKRRRSYRSGETDENGNNTNNNQTENRGAWGRVSGRLLRIGRYLLRKFQFFLW